MEQQAPKERARQLLEKYEGDFTLVERMKLLFILATAPEPTAVVKVWYQPKTLSWGAVSEKFTDLKRLRRLRLRPLVIEAAGVGAEAFGHLPVAAEVVAAIVAVIHTSHVLKAAFTITLAEAAAQLMYVLAIQSEKDYLSLGEVTAKLNEVRDRAGQSKVSDRDVEVALKELEACEGVTLRQTDQGKEYRLADEVLFRKSTTAH